MHCQHPAQTVRRIIMWIPNLNVGLGLDHSLVSRANWYCGNPVIQVVNRDHERIGTDPAVCEGARSGFPGGINSVGASSGNA